MTRLERLDRAGTTALFGAMQTFKRPRDHSSRREVFCTIFAAWFAWCCAGPASAAEQTPQFIVRDGKPLAEIVIAEQPARMTRLAANELQETIRKISGAELPIVTQPTAENRMRIYLGESSFTRELGLEVGDLRYGAFRRASGPGWFALLGPDRDFVPVEPWHRSRARSEIDRVNQEWDAITGEKSFNPFWGVFMGYYEELDIWEYDEAGTLNAVHDFLRSLGVRWFMPGELGEVIPQLTDIAVPAGDEVVRPAFDLREFTYFYPHDRDGVLWNLRMGLNKGHDIRGLTQGGHGMKFVHMRDEYKEAHPDHFAIWGGEPALHQKGAGMPRLSSPGLKEKHLKFARAIFDHYGEPMLSLDVPDGFYTLCERDQDRATPERGFSGSLSDYVWGYIDSVARELYRSHPDRLVSGGAYAGYELPPLQVEQFSPNVAVWICQHRSRFHDPAIRERFRNLRKQWLEKLPSGQLINRDYELYNWPKRGTVGLPAYYPRLIADDLRELRGISRGDRIEVYHHRPGERDQFDWNEFAVNHVNLYITSRMLWDPDLDVEELLEDYYQSFYGPAAPQMRTFIEYCEQNWPQMTRSVEPIDRALELLAAAETAADPESVYGQRIAVVANYVRKLESQREQLAREREGPVWEIPRRPAADIQVDGDLSDPFWEGVPAIKLRERHSGEDPQHPTEVRMAWGDNDSLFLAIRCSEPALEQLLDTADGGVGIFNGDTIDLLIETPLHAYYQLTFSPSGAMLDMDRNGEGGRTFHTGWASSARVAAGRGDNEWTLEIQIPAGGEMARLIDPDAGIAGRAPTADAPWYFNIGRSRKAGGEPFESSAFSPTGERHFHDRFLFGTLTTDD